MSGRLFLFIPLFALGLTGCAGKTKAPATAPQAEEPPDLPTPDGPDPEDDEEPGEPFPDGPAPGDRR